MVTPFRPFPVDLPGLPTGLSPEFLLQLQAAVEDDQAFATQQSRLPPIPISIPQTFPPLRPDVQEMGPLPEEPGILDRLQRVLRAPSGIPTDLLGTLELLGAPGRALSLGGIDLFGRIPGTGEQVGQPSELSVLAGEMLVDPLGAIGIGRADEAVETAVRLAREGLQDIPFPGELFRVPIAQAKQLSDQTIDSIVRTEAGKFFMGTSTTALSDKRLAELTTDELNTLLQEGFSGITSSSPGVNTDANRLVERLLIEGDRRGLTQRMERSIIQFGPADIPQQLAPTQQQQVMARQARQFPRQSAARVDETAQQAEQNFAAQLMGGQQPPRQRSPGQPQGANMGTPPPRQPDVGLGDDFQYPSHEKFTTAVMRKWEGARNLEGLSMVSWFDAGINLMKTNGIKRFDAQTMRPLFEALHGERSIDELPMNLRPIYDDLITLRNQEQEDTLAFMGAVDAGGARSLLAIDAREFASRMMAHPSYFPRGWKQPHIQAQPSQGGVAFGARPGYTRPRNDASFGEMVDAGWNPVSWNPYTMMAMRRLHGIEYRESVKLFNRLHVNGLAFPANEVLDDKKWRIPRIGPVFEGRPITLSDGTTGFSRRLAVTNEVADFLENAFGRTPEAFVGDVNIIEVTRKWSNALKLVKVAGSLFQHRDFLQRAIGAAFTPTGILNGAPLGLPSLAARMLTSSLLPSVARINGKLTITTPKKVQRALVEKILTDEAMYADFPITLRMVAEEGWGIQGDVSLIRREWGGMIAEELANKKVAGKALERGKKIAEFFSSGLFDGVYREAQIDALQKFVIPAIRSNHPTWVPQQVAAEAAGIVNKQFSTLGNWQTVLKSPGIRQFLHQLIFSTNESEALLAQFFGTLPFRPTRKAPFITKSGTAKKIWLEWHLGQFIALAGVANIINYAATGKPLPKESYNPFNLDDPWGPFKIGYATKFLAPQIPGIRGRNDTPMYLDIVGQLDTSLRWLTNPIDATASRINVIPRAVTNQFKGSGFSGEEFGPIYTPRGFARHVGAGVIDLFGTISGQPALGALREAQPSTSVVLPEQEPRLGVAGQLLQMTGFNLNAETTPDLRNRFSIMTYNRPWDDITRAEKQALVKANPLFAAELEARRLTRLERGPMEIDPSAIAVQRTERLGAAQTEFDLRLEQGPQQLPVSPVSPVPPVSPVSPVSPTPTPVPGQPSPLVPKAVPGAVTEAPIGPLGPTPTPLPPERAERFKRKFRAFDDLQKQNFEKDLIFVMQRDANLRSLVGASRGISSEELYVAVLQNYRGTDMPAELFDHYAGGLPRLREGPIPTPTPDRPEPLPTDIVERRRFEFNQFDDQRRIDFAEAVQEIAQRDPSLADALQRIPGPRPVTGEDFFLAVLQHYAPGQRPLELQDFFKRTPPQLPREGPEPTPTPRPLPEPTPAAPDMIERFRVQFQGFDRQRQDDFFDELLNMIKADSSILDRVIENAPRPITSESLYIGTLRSLRHTDMSPKLKEFFGRPPELQAEGVPSTPTPRPPIEPTPIRPEDRQRFIDEYNGYDAQRKSDFRQAVGVVAQRDPNIRNLMETRSEADLYEAVLTQFRNIDLPPELVGFAPTRRRRAEAIGTPTPRPRIQPTPARPEDIRNLRTHFQGFDTQRNRDFVSAVTEAASTEPRFGQLSSDININPEETYIRIWESGRRIDLPFKLREFYPTQIPSPTPTGPASTPTPRPSRQIDPQTISRARGFYRGESDKRKQDFAATVRRVIREDDPDLADVAQQFSGEALYIAILRRYRPTDRPIALDPFYRRVFPKLTPAVQPTSTPIRPTRVPRETLQLRRQEFQGKPRTEQQDFAQEINKQMATNPRLRQVVRDAYARRKSLEDVFLAVFQSSRRADLPGDLGRFYSINPGRRGGPGAARSGAAAAPNFNQPILIR